MARQKINAGTQLSVGVSASATPNMAVALNGSSILPVAAQPIVGSVVQVASTQSSSLVSATSAIPADGTIPQVGEGTQIFSVSITPKSASNRLRIMANVLAMLDNSTQIPIAIALFRDGAANAIASSFNYSQYQTLGGCIVLLCEVAASSTSATTFTLRIGATSSYIWYMNASASSGGGQTRGGTETSSLSIWEIAA